MIPEFPLPPNEADFYHSKLYERPPLFGVFMPFELPELQTAHTESIINPIDLARPLKMAAIRARPSLPKMSRTAFAQPSLLSRLTAVAGVLAHT